MYIFIDTLRRWEIIGVMYGAGSLSKGTAVCIVCRAVKLSPLHSLLVYYLRFENAESYVLIAVYLFICMRVTRITQKVLNRIA